MKTTKTTTTPTPLRRHRKALSRAPRAMDTLRCAGGGATSEAGAEDRLETGDNDYLAPRSLRRRGRRRRWTARAGRKGNPQKQYNNQPSMALPLSNIGAERQREEHPPFLQRGKNRLRKREKGILLLLSHFLSLSLSLSLLLLLSLYIYICK